MKSLNHIIPVVVLAGTLAFTGACSRQEQPQANTQPATGTAPAGPAARTEKGNRVDVVSAYPYAQTVDNLNTALKGQGMMIVATIDHQNMLSMAGASIKGAKTLEFGKPDMGKMLLPMHPEAGLEMPGKIYVWERSDGKTVVSYYKASAGFSNYDAEEVKKMGDMMDMMVSQIVQKATS